MLLLVRVHLVRPAGVDSLCNDIPIWAHYTTNKEHFDVMLHCREFWVVNSWFFWDAFAWLGNMHTNWRKPKPRLVAQRDGVSIATFSDNAMLLGLDTTLFATLLTVGRDWTDTLANINRRLSWHLHASAMPKIVCNNDKSAKVNEYPAAVLVTIDRLLYDATSSCWFWP